MSKKTYLPITKNMLINDFTKMYCINLPRREDRKVKSQEIFSKFKLNVEFVEAVDGKNISNIGKIKPGEAGCCLSHKKVLQMIIDNPSIKTALIMEDDVEFDKNMPTRFAEYYRQVPNDWKLLYFGGSHRHNPLKKISSHVHRLQKTYTTHCFAIKREAAKSLIKFFADDRIFDKPADLHLAEFQKQHPCYGFIVPIAWQRADYSDIREDFKDYKHIR